VKAKLRPLLLKLCHFCFGPGDPIRLEAFRVVLGLSLLAYMLAWWQHASEWLTPLGYHTPAGDLFHAPFILPPMPPFLLPWFGRLLFGGISLFILGWKLRWTSWLVLGCVIYVTFADLLSSYTINLLYIVTLFILALSVRGVYWSIDRAEPPTQSVWPIRILQLTIVTQYFTAGLCKINNGDWLKSPYVLWSAVQGVYMTDLAAWMVRALPLGLWAWMQYIALSFEILAPFIFLPKRFRIIAFAWNMGFLAIISLTMHMLIYFALQLACFIVLFMEEKTLHRVHDVVLLRTTSR